MIKPTIQRNYTLISYDINNNYDNNNLIYIYINNNNDI